MPSSPEPPPVIPNTTVAVWHFDEVFENGVTPDGTGSNPAILGSTVGNVSFTPVQVEGKIGKALTFNGVDYAYVPCSPSLDIRGEITIDAWINVKEFRNVSHNIIFAESARTAYAYPTRIVGFAVNGENESTVPQGALRGFILDDAGVFNEIVTTRAVISLNQWTHAVFTRSLATGMHIYVDDAEENVTVISGVQNPTGAIAGGSEFYIGHDSISILDEVSISNFAVSPTPPLWMQWWFLTAIVSGIALVLGAVYLLRARRQGHRSPKLL
jgi:hypothetical protein